MDGIADAVCDEGLADLSGDIFHDRDLDGGYVAAGHGG